MKDKFFKYVIETNSGYIKEYLIEFFNQNTEITIILPEVDYSWAKTENINCLNCPIAEKNEYCNLAIGLVNFIDFFNEFQSYDSVRVTVYSNDYTIIKDTTIQQTALSILNLIIPFSTCPKFNLLKYTAMNHIPFESFESLLVRLIGNYYLKYISLHNFNDVLIYTDFIKTFKEMRTPIQQICSALRKFQKKDATLNSLILLDTYLLLMTDILDHYKYIPTVS